MSRLALHHGFQGAQRQALSNLLEESRRNPTDLLVLQIDKMDQLKSTIPHVHAMRATQLMKNGKRFVVGITCVLVPGLSEHPITITSFEDTEHGASFQASIMLQVMRMIRASFGTLPRKLVWAADNTSKETKNTICAFFFVWCLANLAGEVDEIQTAYLMTGHTHNEVDRWFSYAMRALSGETYFTLENMFSILEAKLSHPPVWVHARDVYNFRDREHRPAGVNVDAQHVRGIAAPHHFRFLLDAAGNCIVQTKRWLSDLSWSQPQVLVPAEAVRRLRGWDFPVSTPSWDRNQQGEREPERDAYLSWIEKLGNLDIAQPHLERLRQAPRVPRMSLLGPPGPSVLRASCVFIRVIACNGDRGHECLLLLLPSQCCATVCCIARLPSSLPCRPGRSLDTRCRSISPRASLP